MEGDFHPRWPSAPSFRYHLAFLQVKLSFRLAHFAVKKLFFVTFFAEAPSMYVMGESGSATHFRFFIKESALY
jgi:hypothetical protein